MPVWPVAADNIMEFYPRWFDQAIENRGDYNYYEANIWRSRIKDFSAGKDARGHPVPRSEIDEPGPRLCVVPPVGAIMLFSGDQLHPTIPNTSKLTRYSIDLRTVDRADIRDGTVAPGSTPRAKARPCGTSTGSPTERRSPRTMSRPTTPPTPRVSRSSSRTDL